MLKRPKSHFSLITPPETWRADLAVGVPEVVIAFMGVTGSGKSSFVKAITGRDDIVVGDHLKSTTTIVQSYRCQIEGTRFVLVDTPGFDDTYRSEQDILREISDWLAKTYATGKKLNGLIYLHPINTTRVNGSALLNLRVFEKLCGAQAFKHVFLCSTFWDVVEEATGAAREKELCESEDLWGRMKREGAQVVRITEYHLSKDILLQIAQKPTMALDVQKELVDDQVDISDTGAARLANKELEKLRAENEAMKKRATETAAVELEAKEVDNQTKIEQHKKRQEQLRQAQLKLAEQQRVEQERITKLREADAERRLKEEKRKQARLEAEARQRLREHMLEEKRVQKEMEENKRRRKRLEWLNSIRLEQQRFSETTGLHTACLHRAQAMGTIQARIWGMHQQTPAFELACDYCFRLIGFSPSWRKQSPHSSAWLVA